MSNPVHDQAALDVAAEIMTLVNGLELLGGDTQLKARIQCLVIDALEVCGRKPAVGQPVAIVSRFFIDPWYDQSGQGGGWRHEVKLLTDLPDGDKLYAMGTQAGV